MKRNLSLRSLLFFFLALCSNNNESLAQCQPYIKIDGVMTIANTTSQTGITLPFWLKEGQTLAADQMVQSISVIEFTVNANALEFSQVRKITTVQTVPVGKVWKIESIGKTASLSNTNGALYSSVGTYSLTVPNCASYLCIEVWGGGGGGNNSTVAAGGGGGGAYGQGCFTVTPGTVLTVVLGNAGTVGAPGTAGGTSSVNGTGVSISASGGAAGGTSAGGAGGSSIT